VSTYDDLMVEYSGCNMIQILTRLKAAENVAEVAQKHITNDDTTSPLFVAMMAYYEAIND
jgi:hypothetical protein